MKNIFGQGSFIMDPNATPEQVAAKRKGIADIMAGRYGSARTKAEGWTHLLSGLLEGIGEVKLSGMERDRRAGADEEFNSVMGGWSPFGGATPAASTTARNDAMERTGGPTQAAADELGIRAGLIERGLPEHIADGILMNMRDESGLNPAAVGDNGNAFGLAQWNGPRKAALESFAAGRGAQAGDVGTQLDFLMSELQGPEKAAGAKLMATQTPGEAGAAFLNHFERPAEEHRVRREAAYLGGAAPAGGMSMPAYSGPSVQDLVKLQANPWLTPEQRSAVGVMLKTAQDATDPLKQMQLQTAQLELQRAQNPEAFRMLTGDEATAMGLPAGGAYQVGRDGKVSAVVTPSKTGAGGTEYGLTPQYGVDKDGNPVMIQIGKDGTSVQTPLPEGVTFQKEPVRIDAGTEIILLDPITRQPVGSIPKNNREAAAETAAGSAEGKASAEAAAAAPADYAAADTALQLIDNIRNDPNRARGTGTSSFFNWIPGSAGYDFQNKVDQATSGAFLTAIQAMRGMGALSNAEGAAATQAVTRLNTATSEEAFLEALADYEKIVMAAREKAGGVMAGSAAGAAADVRQQIDNIPDFGAMSDAELEKWIEQNG